MQDPRFKPLQEKADGLVSNSGGGTDNVAANNNDGKEYVVKAQCLIRIGDVCTIDFPDHEDHESYMFHLNCHGHKALISCMHESGFGIRMMSGPWKDAELPSIQSKWMFFEGPFARQE